MSAPLDLLPGAEVTVEPPELPLIQMAPPTVEPVVVVPVVGPPGPAGVGSATNYTHVQVTPETVWTIDHNFGKYPTAWSLFDNTGRECDFYEIQHMSINQCRVSMDIPTAGVIRLI